MAFSNPNVLEKYLGNNSQTVFNITQYFIDNDYSNLHIELWDVTDYDAPVQKTLPDYTLQTTPFAVVFTSYVPTPDDMVLIYREGDLEQPTSFVNGAFPADSVEDQFDRVIMRMQEIDEALGRAFVADRLLDPLSPEDVRQLISLEQRILDIENSIPAVDPPTTDIIGTGVFTPEFGERLIVNTNDAVEIQLPTPQSGKEKIIVKFTESVDNKKVTAAVKIDDIELAPTRAEWIPLAAYESVTFLCNDSQWYIV